LEKQETDTSQEYLDFEIQAQESHEYKNGKIILMPGETLNHNRITGNFYASLNVALKGQTYDVFFIDQRLWIPHKKTYTYPDIMLIQGKLQLEEGRKDKITNPLLIVEVLSRSTEAYDRGEQFAAYRTIPSLREYILIEQYTPHIEQFSKTQSGRWLLSDYEGKDTILSLTSVPLEMLLADIYDRVDFPI
ncbi:MAG: Uma2 family endonuclease, partial [Cyanobacteria bacterium P01_G01_bin.49]